MAISLFIRDAFTKYAAHVTKQHQLLVIDAGYPALKPQKTQLFRQYMTVDGLSSGSNDMGIDGSSTNVDFYVEADPDNDRYITNIGFIVGYGTSAQPFQFADAAALSNGIQIFYETATRGAIDLHEGVKSNQDFFRLSHQRVDANWEVRGVSAINDYGYFINIDLDEFMPPHGLKLDRGTRQRFVACVKDDCTNADNFSAIAYGFDRFE